MKLIKNLLLTETNEKPTKGPVRTFKNNIRIFCDYGYLYINHSTRNEKALFFCSLDNYYLAIDKDTKTIEYHKNGCVITMKFMCEEDFYYCRGCLIDFETHSEDCEKRKRFICDKDCYMSDSDDEVVE